MALANIVKSSLGPVGLDKMLVCSIFYDLKIVLSLQITSGLFMNEGCIFYISNSFSLFFIG
jgi:hypothetical protein